jgi:hypothetical protein
MKYPFTYPLTEAGAHVGTMFGTARIGPLHGASWTIIGIELETQSGLKPTVDVASSSMHYAPIVLHLLNNHRADIDAEWVDYAARRRPMEAA